MADRPRLLDLFCGAGGAGMGYHRAGFEVVGVDINPQPNYPFEFIQADAVDVLRAMTDYPTASGEVWRPGYFAAVHASPPCQNYSAAMAKYTDGRHPSLLAPTRAALMALGIPYVIENVMGAPMNGFVLCGSLFDLPIRRHRHFETNPFMLVAPHRHRVGDEHPVPVTGGRLSKALRAERPWRENVTADEARAAMGIDWMTRDELSEAIPPAYTEHIGRLLLEALERVA